MKKISSSFIVDDELLIVEADITGPAGPMKARLALDTGAAATTVTPEVAEAIGYTWRDGYKISKVRTAIGEEIGYWLGVDEISALGVPIPNFALTVFPLAYDDIDGLLGMNFLRYLDFEIRMSEQRIYVERIS